jgi:hypothetical protein
MKILREAGLQAYDGIANEVELERAYNRGYYDGAEAVIKSAARRVLGLEP